MNPSLAADLRSAREKAVSEISDKFTSPEQVRHRLDFFLWRVIMGRCSDFDGPQGNTTHCRYRSEE